MKRFVSIVLCLLLAWGLLFPTALAHAESADITAVTIELPAESDPELTVGETLALSAHAEPAEADPSAVVWSSDAPSCASVNDAGLVTAHSVGQATITLAAAQNGDIRATLTVTVADAAVTEPVAATGVTLTAAQSTHTSALNTLAVGETLPIQAAVSPADAHDPSVSWSVTNGTGTASIDESGHLTGLSAGTVVVTATANGGTDVSGTLELSIIDAPSAPVESPSSSLTPQEAIPVSGITVTGEGGALTVLTGETLQLHAAVSPADAAVQAVVWSIDAPAADDAGTASIDENGLLSGIAAGPVTVRATAMDDSGVSATLALTVEEGLMTLGLLEEGSVTISAQNNAAALAVGRSLQLTAAVLPEGSAQEVVWSISAGADCATVSADGLVSATAEGSVTVKAAMADNAETYNEIALSVVPYYKYVLVVNTNPAPTNEQSTGTLVFGGSGASAQTARTSQAYSSYSGTQASASTGGYSVGESKSIGYNGNYVCIGVGAHCYIWMEAGLRTDYLNAGKLDTIAAEMMAVYEGRPYEALTALAGGEIPAMDGTQKLSILLEQTDSSGYFAGEDGITAIHIQTSAAEDYVFGELSSYAGLLAHEGQHALFQHYVCGDNAGIELPLRWLNEGLSVAAMDWVWGGDGNGSSGWLSTVSGNARICGGESLAYANYRSNSGLDYGLPYLFIRYLCDQAAQKYDPLPYMKKFYQKSYTGGSVSGYLNEVIASLGLPGNASFSDALKNFYIAAVVQSGSGVNGFYGDPVVKTRMRYPVFDGASNVAYTLPGTGALVLMTNDGVFTPPTDGVGSDIAFIPFNESTASSGWGGGTIDDPYQVGSASILNAIALNPSGYYKLTSDITIDGTIFTIDNFSGTLDGNGHTIRGLKKPLIYENSGTVCNLNVELAMTGDFGGYAGGVVCHNTGTIRNVRVTGSFGGTLTGVNPFSYPTVGALAGQNDGAIHECKADVAMSFSSLPANHVYLGQIAGRNSARIYNCIAAGSIRAAQNSAGAYRLYAGGLAGSLQSSYFAASLKWSYSLTQLAITAGGSGNIRRVGRLVGCEEKTGAYNSYVEACYGLDGDSVAAAGSVQSVQAGSTDPIISDTACLRSTAQLQTRATYTGWSFGSVWSLPSGSFPVLGAAASVTLTVSGVKSSYYVGEALDLSGSTVSAGSPDDAVAITKEMLYALPDMNTPGSYTVRGVYDTAAFSFPVTVSAPAAAAITALSVSTPAKSNYFAGQVFEPDGVKLSATIGGSAVTIVSGFSVSKTTALSTADTAISYTYCGKTASQPIRVSPKAVVSIVRTGAMTRTAFSDAETLSLAGLTLRITYSDGEQVDGVTAASLGRYGLMLLRLNSGTPEAFPVSKSLSAANDHGAELYVYAGSAVPSSLTGGAYCYAATLTVGNVAHMADQLITLHTGIDEYVWSDPVEGGSGSYSTTLASGTLPAGISAVVPDSGGYSYFAFYGTPRAQFDVSLRYRVRDTVQAREFYVTIRLKAVPPSDACDVLDIRLSNYPCTIEGTTISVVLPRGASLNRLNINAMLSPGATQDKINGTNIDASAAPAPTLTVYAQSNPTKQLLAGKYKTYTIRAVVASGGALPALTGLRRTDSVVSWTPVTGADRYLVTLVRTYGEGYDDPVGSFTVASAQFDIRSVAPRTGNYYITVRAVNTAGAYSPSPESGTANSPYYCNLTPVSRIVLSGAATVNLNQTARYTAAITPANAGITDVLWSVVNGTGTAAITQAGVLTGTKAGTVKVKAAAKDGSGVYAEYAVTIAAVAASRTVTVDVAGLNKPSRVLWIDGVPYSGSDLTVSGTRYSVNLTNTNATNAIVYSYNSLTETDAHKVYPTAMAVWLLTYTSTGYVATRSGRLDNLLRYAGSSIRITGVKGIRMITSIATATKTALTGSGIDGYTLLEYGTVVAWKSEIGANPLVLGKSYSKTAYAYKKNVADPVFKQANGLTQYTNVLVGISNEKCRPDLLMRPYIILQNAAGQKLTLYGGMIERSIGYIAYQNRNAFAPKSAAYNYIWDIIHYVYAKAYDSEYKG